MAAMVAASTRLLALEAAVAADDAGAATNGWGSLLGCAGSSCLERESHASAPILLELEAQLAAPWKSKYSLTSASLPLWAIRDHIARVHRWEGFMNDPQAPWRSGYLNASYFYQKPYILGYMGKRDTVYSGPPAFEAPSIGEKADTSTMGGRPEDEVKIDIRDPAHGTTGTTPGYFSSAVFTAVATATDDTNTGGGTESEDGEPGTEPATGDPGTNTDTDSPSDYAGPTATATATGDIVPSAGQPPGQGPAATYGDLSATEVFPQYPQESWQVSADTDVGKISYRNSGAICLLQILPTARCKPIELEGDNGSDQKTPELAYSGITSERAISGDHGGGSSNVEGTGSGTGGAPAGGDPPHSKPTPVASQDRLAAARVVPQKVALRVESVRRAAEAKRNDSSAVVSTQGNGTLVNADCNRSTSVPLPAEERPVRAGR